MSDTDDPGHSVSIADAQDVVAQGARNGGRTFLIVFLGLSLLVAIFFGGLCLWLITQTKPALRLVFAIDETGGETVTAADLDDAAKAQCAIATLPLPTTVQIDDDIDVLLSAPTINSPIRGQGIISGVFSNAEVYAIVDILQAGQMPIRLQRSPLTVESTEIPMHWSDLFSDLR